MYKLSQNGVTRLSDGASIPQSPDNRDWQQYQNWLDEGNTPDPQFTKEEKAERDLQEQRRAKIEELKVQIRSTKPPQSLPGLSERVDKIEQVLRLTEVEL